METVQSEMHKNLLIAMDRVKNLSRKKRELAGEQIKKIISLKYQMETLAVQRGYSQACRSSIPICRGECCKWHFPKNLTPVDFLIGIFSLPDDQLEALEKQISNRRKNQCPILLETGCFLSFEQRPVPCTNAYPCFADRSYWLEKEKANIEFKKAVEALEAILF